MRDDATAVDIHARSIPRPVEIRPHMRLLHGMRRPANWLQLVRFGIVGSLGFVINLAVYTLCVHGLAIDYHVAAVTAWLVAVANNFVLNRHWTFDAAGGHAGFQAARFIAVSLVAFGVSLLLLTLLVGTGTLGGIASATQGALVRSVVPEASYVPARSLIRIAAQVAQVGGNPLGGLLLVATSPGGAFLISSAALVIAASLVRFGLGQYPVTGATDGTALLRDSLRGVRQVFSYVPLRRLLLLAWLVPMFSVAPEALAAPYVAGQHGSPALVGWWLAALPAIAFQIIRGRSERVARIVNEIAADRVFEIR